MENIGAITNHYNQKEKTNFRDVNSYINNASSKYTLKIKKNFSIKTNSSAIPVKNGLNKSNYNNIENSQGHEDWPANQKSNIFQKTTKKDNFVINRQTKNYQDSNNNNLNKGTSKNYYEKNHDKLFSTVANANLQTQKPDKKKTNPESLKAMKIKELLKRKQHLQERIDKNEKELDFRSEKLEGLESEIKTRNDQIM